MEKKIIKREALEALEAIEGLKDVESLGEKLKKISDSLARASEGLADTISPSPFKIDYDKIYEKWFPGEILTIERFEGLPKRILKLFGADCIYMLSNEYFTAARELTALPTAKRLVREALVNAMKNISRTYRVDLIDIEERLKQKKVSEERIEMIKRFFL